ncbi:MAG: universal stress protein [Notoacmeibacter sp.]|nr:universal stress protein [Notoacmeibacter sp.]
MVMPPARAIAKALGADLAFFHVIETEALGGPSPSDPVEWEIKRREANAFISNIARQYAGENGTAEVHVLEGRCAEQICGALSGHPEDIVAIFRGDGWAAGHIGGTARQILEGGTNSLLLSPAMTEPPVKGFTRIIVPLDGSGQSEMAIPVAVKIAASEDAELLLVHATPETELTRAGPAEPDDAELLDRIRQRNERVARKYLNRLGSRVRTGGLRIRTLVLSGGDVRRQLVAAIREQSADLLVLASHGQSGYADVALGNVANYLLSRSSVPVLMVRSANAETNAHVFSGARAKGTRKPGAVAQ